MDVKDLYQDEVDLEEEIDRFTIRISKSLTSECQPAVKSYKNETNLIPLLINDIHQLNVPYKIFSEKIKAYGIPFSQALIYGRISFAGAGSDCRLRYYLDDGTGIIKLRLLKHKTLNSLSKLDSECTSIFGNNKELLKSVQNILKTARIQLLDMGLIPYGTKALVLGRPHKFFEETIFSVFELIIDNKPCRDLEISVKNFLIDWYTNKYRTRGLNDTHS